MQKYQQAAISIAFLTVILSAGVCNGFNKPISDQIDDNSLAQQEAILQTFENNDYEGWRKLIGRKSEISHIVNRDEFQMFVAARNIARAGGYDQALALTKSLEQELKDKMGAEYLA